MKLQVLSLAIWLHLMAHTLPEGLRGKMEENENFREVYEGGSGRRLCSPHGDGCWLFDPCCGGLSCQPWVHKCYHSPRKVGEPCSWGYSCGYGLTCEAGTYVCRAPGVVGSSCHATRPCGNNLSCQPGVHKCYHNPRKVGEPCVAGYPCAAGLTCEAGSQVCRAPGVVGSSCHATRPCGNNLSCQPGVHKCYHSPRQHGEPCVTGHECGNGLSCQPGVHKCYNFPRTEGEPCVAGHECKVGLQCEAGRQICRPPAKLGESCHLTRYCDAGLKCQEGSQKCIIQPYVFKSHNCLPSTASSELTTAAASTDNDSIRIMTYNIYQIFTAADYARLGRLLEWIATLIVDHDIILMQETWEAMTDTQERKFIDQMSAAGYCHNVYDDRPFLTDEYSFMGSGLAVFSKYEILEHDFMNFAFYCTGSDCFADKGVVYTKIRKANKNIHIFNTHTNSGIGNHELRRLQYEVIHDFINSKNIPSNETILIGGDLNEDKLSTITNYNNILSDLDADDFLFVSNQISSYDSQTNSLVSEDDTSEALDFILFRGDSLISPSSTPTLTARTHTLAREKFVARVLSKASLRAEPNAAKCLDGSPAVYYIKLGTAGAGGTDKLMVHFGGGGWCIDKLNCSHRATQQLGSSLYGDYVGGMQAYVNHYIKSDTYFSDSQVENPEFYSHTKVFVRYCDGGSFAGHKPFDPNFPLYFRGKLIVDAVFEDLFELDERFKEAKDVVITGGSAGGMAVFLNIDRIKKRYFPDSFVMGIPNAGYFPGTQGINAQGIHWSHEMLTMAELHGITHPGGSLEGSKCLSNKAVPAWCIFPSLIVQYIETPMFIVNSVFDSYVSQYALGIPEACGVAGACDPPSGVHAIHQMHALRQNILSSLAIAPTVVSGRSAYFTHACPTHGEQLNSPGRWKKLQNPADRQWTLYKTLNLWHRSLVAGKITMVPNSIGGGLWGNKYDIHAIWPNYRDESCY